MFPEEEAATSITVPELQRDAGVVEVIDGEVLIVAIIAVLVGVVHPELVASI